MDKDLKDIVGVTGNGKVKKEKKKPAPQKKPDGLSRELYGLVGSTTVEVPLYPADPMRGLKQKRKVKPTAAVQWERCELPCSTRTTTDSLRFTHWLVKDQKDKFQDNLQVLNKEIRVFKYTDTEYEAHLKDPTGKWTKELTDELFRLCHRFQSFFELLALDPGLSGLNACLVDPSCCRQNGLAPRALLHCVPLQSGNMHLAAFLLCAPAIFQHTAPCFALAGCAKLHSCTSTLLQCCTLCPAIVLK